jgi:stage IV sporulation protein FB
MFFSVPRTQYDLRFEAFGIPVTVSPFFWAMSILFGVEWVKVEPGGPANIFAWVVAVFVSILVHEFGHALVIKAYRHRPEIVLYHFGGYATSRSHGMERAWRSFLISAAGPGASFALFLIVLGSSLALIRDDVDWLKLLHFDVLMSLHWSVPDALAHADFFNEGTPLYVLISSLLYVNFFWMLINLLPVLPLDGGNILRSILEMAKVENATDWAVKVSVGVGAIVALGALLQGEFYLALLFVSFAALNYRTLNSQRYGSF